jgi:hypothetical protein
MLARRVQFLLVTGVLAFALPAWSQLALPQASESMRSDHHKILSNLRTTFAPYSDSTIVSKGGRTDRVLLTQESWDVVRSTFQQAHSRMTILKSGGKIAGWYVNKSKRSATFTVHLNDHSYTIAAREIPGGTRITVWGDARRHSEVRRTSTNRSKRDNRVPGLYRL